MWWLPFCELDRWCVDAVDEAKDTDDGDGGAEDGDAG